MSEERDMDPVQAQVGWPSLRTVMWRHGYPRIIARVVWSALRNQGLVAGVRVACRAGWLMLVVPFARNQPRLRLLAQTPPTNSKPPT